MPGPQPSPIELDAESRKALEEVTRRHSTPQQVALRAQIILHAAAGRNHSQIARELKLSIDMARLWRRRWLSFAKIPLSELSILERLADEPRAGRPPTISAEAVCQIVALACEAPEKAGRPISHWTAREIAEEIMQRDIVESISPRHAQRLLKRGICSRTSFATG